MSDVGIPFGPLAYVFFALMMAWPAMGIGVVCGALAWRGRRGLGGAIGAALGLVVGVAGFFAWRNSRLTMNVDYYAAVERVLLGAAPGAIVGAALGGWYWRSARDRGVVVGGLAGGALGLLVWVGIRGGL